MAATRQVIVVAGENHSGPRPPDSTAGFAVLDGPATQVAVLEISWGRLRHAQRPGTP